MFAVLKSNSNDVVAGYRYVCHISNDRESADTFVQERVAVSSHGLYTVWEFEDIKDLVELVMPQPEPSEEVDVLNDVLKKLEELVDPANAEKFAAQIQEQTGKVVAEVKSMGIAGMKAVGDGFVALGDLLRNSANEEKK
jgi:hypothetical protein